MKSLFPTMSDLNVSFSFDGEGALGHVGKAEPPESILPGLCHMGRGMSNCVGDYSCHSALPSWPICSGKRSKCVFLCSYRLGVSLVPSKDQFLCLHLVAPVGGMEV